MDGYLSAFGVLIMVGGVITWVAERSGLSIPFLLFGFMIMAWGLAEKDEEVHSR